MDSGLSDGDSADEGTANQIELLYQAVVRFRRFLAHLTPVQRAALGDAMPWSNEGAELWIDFEAWVQVSLAQLRRPQEQRHLK